MKNRSHIWVAVAVLLLGGWVAQYAAGADKELPPAKAALIEGTIKSVDIVTNSFVLSTKEGDNTKDMTLTINDQTKYWLDGKEVKREDALMALAHAKVTHTNGLASKVEVMTKK